MRQAFPLRLPALTRAEAAAARRRHANRGPLELGGASLRLRLSEAAGDACGPEPMCVALRWGTADIALHCPAGLVRERLRQLDPNLDLLDALPPDLAAVLLEAACLDLLSIWEQASSRSIQIRSVLPVPEPGAAGLATPPPSAPGPAPGLVLELQDGPRRSRMHVHGAAPHLDAILSLWPPAPRAMERLGFPAVLRRGTTRLSAGMVRSLRPGDAVLLEQHDGAGARLVLAGGWNAGAVQVDGAWRLTERPAPSPSRAQGGWAMPNEHMPNEYMPDEYMPDEYMPDEHGTAEPAADPDDIPVVLTFEVGRLAVTLGQLRGLGAGSVLELGRSRDGLVEIAAHGRPVGQGELVEIEGAIGVRIVRLFDHG